MNLFKFLKRTKPAEGVSAPAVVAKPEGPPPYIKTWQIIVPAGHVMPLGGALERPLKIAVEAGVRWHPEWAEPRITVNVWHRFPMGDAVGWSGPKALAFKSHLDPDVVALANLHGQCLDPTSIAILKRMGLEAPKVPQPLSSFIAFQQSK